MNERVRIKSRPSAMMMAFSELIYLLSKKSGKNRYAKPCCRIVQLLPIRRQLFNAATFTIHGTPNLSVNMPNDEVQNVFIKGIVTIPPSLSAVKTRLASASSATSMASVMPLNSAVFSPHTVVGHQLRFANAERSAHDFFFIPGRPLHVLVLAFFPAHQAELG